MRRAKSFSMVLTTVALATALVLFAGVLESRAHDDDEGSVFVVSADGKGAYLGVHVDEETEHPEGGARVSEVVDDSPAEKAGIRAGDIIIGFDGEPIRGPVRLTERIRAREAGENVSVTVLRDGKRTKLNVELGERAELWRHWWTPGEGFDEEWAEQLRENAEQWSEQYRQWQEEHGEQWAEQYREWAEEYAEKYRNWAEQLREQWSDYEGSDNLFFFRSDRPKLGVYLIETTEELREHLGGTGEAGVLVSKVVEDGPAARAGVRVGDLILSVDGETVDTSFELIRALGDKGGKTVELELVRNGRRLKVSAELEESEGEEGRPRASLAPLVVVPDLTVV